MPPAAPTANEPTAPAKPGPPLWAWATLIALGILWGGSFATTGAAVRELPPLTVVAARLVIGAAILLPLSYWLADGLPRWRTEEGRKVWIAALIAALAANSIPFALLSWAQTLIPSGVAAIYMASLPLVVLPLAAWLVPGETLSGRKILGFVIGFIGVAALIGVEGFARIEAGWLPVLAQLACITAAAGYAIGSIVLKLAPRAHPVSFGAATIGLAALVSAPLALIAEDPFAAAWSAQAVATVLFLGAGPTALAMVLLYEVLRMAGPSFLSLVNYQVPAWAVIFGVAFLGETIPPAAPLALATILAGVAISQSRGRKTDRADAPSA